jgi:hypothetical protein
MSVIPIDDSLEAPHNTLMTTNTVIPAESMEALEKAALRAARGERGDREARKRASELMDQLGDEIYRREGILDIAVPAIRELRDS